MLYKHEIKLGKMKLNGFFTDHAVFTLKDLDDYLKLKGAFNLHTRNAILAYYRNKGRLVAVRRGLYMVVSGGSLPENNMVDPYLLAAKMTKDAVLGYHTALEFHGKAYSVFNQYHYLSKSRSLAVEFRSNTFVGVTFSQSLCDKNQEMFGVISHRRLGVDIRVTSLERTFVDVLDRPELAGGWEEIWRSLEQIEFFDLDKVVEYVQLLDNATTAAKVGFFLEKHKETLMVDDKYFNQLKELVPKQPHYLNTKEKSGHLMKEWNIIVPQNILDKTWQEVL